MDEGLFLVCVKIKKINTFNMKKISKSLETWFLIHFALDYLFGIPLLFAAAWTTSLFGFSTENLLFARMIGAALLGIGGISFIAHKAGIEVYKNLLTMKLIWSGTAIIALIISIVEGAPKATWLFFGIYAFFFFLWLYYRRKI